MVVTRWAKYIGETNDIFVKGKVYQIAQYYFDEEMISLTGIMGKYDIKNFVYVEESETKPKQTYIAFTGNLPKIGKEMFFKRINKGQIQPLRSSKIIDISCVEGNIYRIETEYAVYITEIGN